MEPKAEVDPRNLLLDLTRRLQDSVSAISGDDMSEVRYRVVLLGLFIKACRVHQAIYELLRILFIPEALSLLRVLSETVINLRYIAEDDQLNRAHRYVDWMILDDEKMGRACEGIKSFKGFYPKDTQEYLRNTSRLIKERWKIRKRGKLDQLLRKMGLARLHLLGSSGWSGKSTEDMARELKLANLYVFGFRYPSRSVHATDFTDYLRFDQAQNGFVIGPSPNDPRKISIEATSNIALAIALEKTDQVFSVGLGGEIEKLKAGLIKK